MAVLALHSYAEPSQSSSVSLAGKVRNRANAPDFPYMIRAGDLIRVNDYDPSVAQLVGGAGGKDAAIAFVQRTSYSADQNSLTLELGKRNVALDLLMARLGMGSSSIR
jgi:hypothetical protein